MCGIFAFLTKNAGIVSDVKSNSSLRDVEEILNFAFMVGRSRGPEDSKSITSESTKYTLSTSSPSSSSTHYNKDSVYWYAGFHRLAINGLTEAGMQPFIKDGVVLLCNGEIYNYESLYSDIGIIGDDAISRYCGSDCQVILDYYLKYGIEYTVSKIHGVFAFVLIDTRNDTSDGGKMYVVRDRIGIRSLYWAHADASASYVQHPNYGRTYAVASELKQLTSVARRYRMYGDNPVHKKSSPLLIQQFPAGHIASIDMLTGEHVMTRYWSAYEHVSYATCSRTNYKRELVESLYAAVKLRVDACEREICCLLSGGLDSSLIASMVSRLLKERGQRVKTFSIGMPGSEDLRCAQIVADYIGSDHTEIITSHQEMFDSIPEVVNKIETYDTTSVRASVGNYAVCKYIKENCDAKVVFNGDGADEVMGGYLYFQAINDFNTHEAERLRLITELSHYDVLRSDKCIAGNGLEARTPFLDPDFIRTYFAAARQHYRDTGRMPRVEKELLRTAVSEYGIRQNESKHKSNNCYSYLPDEVLFRRKEAFSDGVSGTEKSWKDVISEMIVIRGIDKYDTVVNLINKSNGKMTSEQAWYKALFESQLLKYGLWFNDLEKTFYERLETRWMPRFVKATDPSARTLEIYAKKSELSSSDNEDTV